MTSLLLTILLLVLSITLSKTQNLDGTPFFMSSLSNTKAARGYEVRLYCQVINKGMSELYWNCVSSEGGDVTIGPDKNTNSALNRYVIDDSAADIGHYNLIISRVRASDNGTCACLVQINDKENIFIRSEALLTVEDEATSPSTIDCYTAKVQSIVHDSNTTLLENETVTLTCTSSGGVPLAYLQWEIVRDESEPEVLHSSTRIIGNTIATVVNYTVTRFDNGAHFRCIQDHVLFPQSVTCKTPSGTIQAISVLYPPVLRFKPASIKISDATNLVTVTCEYEAEPNLLLTGPTIQFAPQTLGETLNYTYTSTDQLNSVNIYLSKDDVGKKLTCSAANQIGESQIELIFQEQIITQERQIPILIISIVGGASLLIILAVCIVCCIYNCNEPLKSAERDRQRNVPSQRVDRIARMEMSTERENGLHNYDESPNGTLASQERRDEPPSYINHLNSRHMNSLSNGSATLPNSSRRERQLQRQRANILEQRSMTTGRRRDDPPSYTHAQSTSSNPQRGRSSRRTDSQQQHQNSIPRAPPPPSPSSTRTATSFNKRQNRPSKHKQQRNAYSGRNNRTSKDKNQIRVMPSSNRSSFSSNPGPEVSMNNLEDIQSVNMGYDSNEG